MSWTRAGDGRRSSDQMRILLGRVVEDVHAGVPWKMHLESCQVDRPSVDAAAERLGAAGLTLATQLAPEPLRGSALPKYLTGLMGHMVRLPRI